jgi:hypothetical protein
VTSVFPKFISRLKSKGQPEVAPPPHTLRFVSKCDIEIGPHIFYDSSFYEAVYTPVPISYDGVSSQIQRNGNSSTFPDEDQSEPVVEAFITPALIALLNETASSNPILQNLLQSAARSEASQEQLTTLGVVIKQLALTQQTQPSLVSGNLANTSSTGQNTPSANRE